jgi:hypothetical protein
MLTPGDGNFYVVTIDAVADPTPPRLEPDGRPTRDLQEEIRELIKSMGDMSEVELAEQVHRRVIIHLCYSCFREWIESPAAQ